MAARVLADWVKKITGADLPIAESAQPGQTPIYIGAAAINAGLKIDDIDSPTHEGLRVVSDKSHILIAGQNSTATVKATCRLLEQLGCRYFMDSPLGEVYPRMQTLAVNDLNLREKPGLDVRMIWGSQWTSQSLWKIWNGAGGEQIGQGHSWGKYVSKDLFNTHPEYFALRSGERKKGDWYCTSNPELRKIFAQGVLDSLADGQSTASISPPDGTAYCECDQCRAQDDPKSIEPSSGRVSITNRYVDFFNDVAKRVGEKYPTAKLGFYCYADYTQAPTHDVKLQPNLVAWIAPLRYCRLHAIGNDLCPSRLQLQQMLEGWAAATHNIAYRTYNYNLAECLVPFSMVSIWAHDVPYLKAHNAIGINLETLPSWQIYGPHIYLSLRIAYDPAADAGKIMDDYFIQFYGTAAGRFMKQYWNDIDAAYATLPVHAGSVHSIHRVYTPKFLDHCRGLLDQATLAAKPDAAFAARVAMHAEGFQNAVQFMAIRDALNTGQPMRAKEVYDRLLERTEAQVTAGYGNHYTPDYLKRFVGGQVTAAATALTAPSRLVQVLHDQWRLAYDEQDKGLDSGYAKPDFDDSKWKTVVTFSDTLDGQGLPDNKTILWYRTTIDVPAIKGALTLLILDTDAAATVYINGQEAGSNATAKKRHPFQIEAAALHPGQNSIALRIDHTAITELSLGGLLRPIYLIEKN